jgi:fructosamine-3-kinase
MGLTEAETQRVADAAGSAVTSVSSLAGGCVGEVYAARLADGPPVVVKVDRSGSGALDTEAYMLEVLTERSDLPSPRALLGDADLLVMTMLPGSTGAGSPEAQRHAADLLADLHANTADRFGLERDTLIGGLPQPNAWSDSWIDFFRERRLLEMARQARDAGRLPERTHARVRDLATRLDTLIDEPEAPALVHGDIWSGNVLSEAGRITGFIDPAVHYAHPEVELAFITLFGTFGAPFFERYHERRPIAGGFFETRRTVYNLYPLLVHVRLFGGGYLGQLESSLASLGA